MAATAQRYTMLRQIASGGMAEVWKATMSGAAGFTKTVAVKRVLPSLAKDREFVDRFIAEARVAAALVHPNIVQVFDFGELEPGVYFIAMEYVPGIDAYTLARYAYESGLERASASGFEKTGASTPLPGRAAAAPVGSVSREGTLTGQGGVLPLEIAVYLCMETARGLGHAHTRKPAIIHRDVSPQNILISFDGDVKLADFGIAKVAGNTTQASVIKGKLSYMSPEQTRGETVDGRSDLFALGVTLYRLLTGRPLFPGDSIGERVAASASYTGIPQEALDLVPQEIRPVLQRALRPRPQDRFPDAAAMETALGDCLGSGATVSIRRALASFVREAAPEAFRMEQREASSAISSSTAGLDTRLSRRRRTIWIAAAAGVAAIGTGVVAGPKLLRGAGPTPTPMATPVAAASTPAVVASVEPITSPADMATPAPVASATPSVSTTAVAAASPMLTAKPIVRSIPTYEVAFLDGCSDADLSLADASIRGAIRRGVGLFNSGNTQGCFEVYRDTASSMTGALPDGCRGPRKAFKDGLDRAAGLATASEKAYALRDTFDGLLAVIAEKRRDDGGE